jgi:hypothetical protein
MRFTKRCKILIHITILIILSLMFFGCNRKDRDTLKSSMDIPVSPTQPAITQPIDINKGNSLNNTEPGASPTVIAQTVPEEYRIYTEFLDITDSVLKFIKEDIDFDGYPEIIIGFPIDKQSLNLYVLREKGDSIQSLGQLKADGYSIYDVKLVKLQDNNNYIHMLLTNGKGTIGFSLISVSNNELNQFAFSAAPNGVGNDFLLDQNKDGLYDGYEQNTSSYDVFNLDVIRVYQLVDGKFELQSTKVKSSELTQNPEDSVSFFIKLNLLMLHENILNGEDILNEINVSGKVVSFQDVTKWSDAFQTTEVTPTTIQMNTIEESEHAAITLHFGQEDLTFKLNKVMNRWIINDMYGDYVIDESDPSVSSDNTKDIAPVQQPAEEIRYIGAIGQAKIHASLTIDKDKVYGEYYYDKNKINIGIKGYVYDDQQEGRTLSLMEDSFQEGTINVIMRSEDYIQGFLSYGEKIYPMYLLREGSGLTPPKEPNERMNNMQGQWTGIASRYFTGSQININVLYDDLLYYELHAFDGAHNGDVEAFAIITNDKAKTIFHDTTNSKDNVIFQFSFLGDNLNLESNQYDYNCGLGVEFDELYTKKNVIINIPSAIEVGIVETKEQDELFHQLVGDRYDNFINYTQFADYSDVIMDGNEVKAGESFLRGMSGYCYYIISEEHLYAAIIINKSIEYYTNDPDYSDKLPEPMKQWARSIKVNYHYVELKSE